MALGNPDRPVFRLKHVLQALCVRIGDGRVRERCDGQGGRDIGAAITLRTTPTRILNSLGALDVLLKTSATLSSASVYSKDGKCLRRWNLPSISTPTIVCSRTDLQHVLLEKYRCHSGRLSLGHCFQRFEQTVDHVTCHFDNGATVEGDVMVGADGLHSHVRRQIVDEGEETSYRGYVQWRFLSPKRHPIVGRHEKKEWWGNGLRFGASPFGEDGMAWYISLKSENPDWTGPPDRRGYFLSLFHGWTGPVLEMIDEVIPEELVWNSIADRSFTDHWGIGRVTMLGDAAHPTTPDLGIGAAMAIEDAEVLVRCLKANGAVVRALRSYEQLRMDKAKALKAGSRFVGEMTHWSNPLMVSARNLLIAKCPEVLWERRLKKTYL